LEAVGSLIVATMDLKVVQLLRDAMRTADLSSGKGMPGALGVGAQFEPRQRLHPTPVIEPRQHLHPTPRIEPRLVYHARPGAVVPPCARPDPSAPPANPEMPRITRSPIEPPWKVLPWEQPAPVTPKLKVVLRRPDVEAKGTLFDVFI